MLVSMRLPAVGVYESENHLCLCPQRCFLWKLHLQPHSAGLPAGHQKGELRWVGFVSVIAARLLEDR